MSQITDFYFPSSAGLCPIHARQWLPDHAPYAGVVQLLHGIAEHIGRYDAFARFLNRHGYIVVGNDHLATAPPYPRRKTWAILLTATGGCM